MLWVYGAIVLLLAALVAWEMVRERSFWKKLGAGMVLLLLALRLLLIQ
jgi:hypothetical protein